jgi:alpha-L-rhamnosidase
LISHLYHYRHFDRGDEAAVDRRTFLSSGLKTGAAVMAAGAMVDAVTDAATPTSASADGTTVSSSGGPRAPTKLRTTGVVAPVGVDPDDVQFSWAIEDARRGAVQSAYRIRVVGPGKSSSRVWDSGPVSSARQAFVSYGGPTLAADSRYGWTVATADRAGRWSEPSAVAPFTTGLRAADWTALWLRPGPAAPGEEEYTYLRTTRSLPSGTVLYATAYVAAAHKYQLWVNGANVDTGPSFCFPDEQYYQATDITAVLRSGDRNVIGILHHWYGPGRGRPTSAPGLLVQVVVHYTNGHVVTLGSDGAWRTRRAEWLPAPQRNNDAGDFVEWIDGRLSPLGWSGADYEDAGWAPAAVRGPVGTEPFTHLYAQRTRITEQTVNPVALRTLAMGSVVIDFGKIYAGRPIVSFEHGEDGHTVPIHVGYTLDPDGSVSTTHNTQGTDLSFSYIQRNGTQTFDPYWYLGFRYLQVDDPGEALGRHQVTLAARHAAMPEQEATFTSSNPMLDAVWAMCAHSGLYTSQEQFIDTPTREKGPFLWDGANESETMMRTYGEQNLSWQGLRDEARAQARYWPDGSVNEVYPNDDGPQEYPTFTARYPEWVWRYYLSTGDRTTVVSLLPTLLRLSEYLAGAIDATTGLVSGLPVPTNGDNQYGYDFNTNADTNLNILTVNAFRRISEAATLAGDAETAFALTGQAAALTTSVNDQLIGSGGIYVDGLRADGTQSTNRSQLANLSALAYGVVPKAQIATVTRYVASLDISVEPDHGMELLRALHAGGSDADVLRILTDPSFPGWAYIIKAGGTFTWETWTPSDLIGDSMSHGWGSSALVAIQEALLGAMPVAPSAHEPPTVVSVTRPSGGLTYASGTFPSPAGDFSVAWRRGATSTRLSVVVPPNAAARCQFPGVATAQVTEAGVPVERAPGVSVVGTAGTLAVVIGAGTYDFTVSAT